MSDVEISENTQSPNRQSPTTKCPKVQKVRLPNKKSDFQNLILNKISNNLNSGKRKGHKKSRNINNLYIVLAKSSWAMTVIKMKGNHYSLVYY